MPPGIAAIFLCHTCGNHRRSNIATIRQKALPDNAAIAVDIALSALQSPVRDQTGQFSRRGRSARFSSFRSVKTPDTDADLARVEPERIAIRDPGHTPGKIDIGKNHRR